MAPGRSISIHDNAGMTLHFLGFDDSAEFHLKTFCALWQKALKATYRGEEGDGARLRLPWASKAPSPHDRVSGDDERLAALPPPPYFLATTGSRTSRIAHLLCYSGPKMWSKSRRAAGRQAAGKALPRETAPHSHMASALWAWISVPGLRFSSHHTSFPLMFVKRCSLGGFTATRRCGRGLTLLFQCR